MALGWDWGEAGGGALAGAGTGAAIGSAVPGVGTLLGAGIGFLGGGLLGGMSADGSASEQERALLGATAAPYTQQGQATLSESQAAQQAAQAGFAPYTGAGQAALQQQQALAGLLGPEAQQQAISMVESSPQYQAMLQQGETAILQNAAATGGLRGGNVQAALAQFRPQLLSSLIEQQYGRLGGLSAAGLQAAGQGAQLGLGYSEIGARTRGEMAAAQAGVPMGELEMKMRREAMQSQQGAGIMGLAGGILGGPIGGALINKLLPSK